MGLKEITLFRITPGSGRLGDNGDKEEIAAGDSAMPVLGKRSDFTSL